jgi:hypothetical protein
MGMSKAAQNSQRPKFGRSKFEGLKFYTPYQISYSVIVININFM